MLYWSAARFAKCGGGVLEARGQHSAPCIRTPARRRSLAAIASSARYGMPKVDLLGRRPPARQAACATQGLCCNWQVLAARPATCGRAVWRRVINTTGPTPNLSTARLIGTLNSGKQSHRFWRLWSSVQASYFEAASTDDKTSRYRS